MKYRVTFNVDNAEQYAGKAPHSAEIEELWGTIEADNESEAINRGIEYVVECINFANDTSYAERVGDGVLVRDRIDNAPVKVGCYYYNCKVYPYVEEDYDEYYYDEYYGEEVE